jgi:DNA-directed RNA polymerase subunit omega
MNAKLVKRALEKVGEPNTLINLISRRVRQLSHGGGAISRPLVSDTANLGLADIALREIIEEKMGWEMPEIVELVRPVRKKRSYSKAKLSLNPGAVKTSEYE